MSGRQPPPCDHYEAQIGTVCAGDISDRSSPFCGVATCAECVAKSQGYVQMQTGLPAQPLLTYEEIPPRRHMSELCCGGRGYITKTGDHQGRMGKPRTCCEQAGEWPNQTRKARQ